MRNLEKKPLPILKVYELIPSINALLENSRLATDLATEIFRSL
jgi:hypothetical protein